MVSIHVPKCSRHVLLEPGTAGRLRVMWGLMWVRQNARLTGLLLGSVPLLALIVACGSGQTGDAGLGDDPIETRQIGAATDDVANEPNQRQEEGDGTSDAMATGTDSEAEPGTDGPADSAAKPDTDDPADSAAKPDTDDPADGEATADGAATDAVANEPDRSEVPTDGDGGVSSSGGSRAIDGVVLLDDAEDGDAVTLADDLGFVGIWYSFDDRCQCDNLDPAGETYPVPVPIGGGEFTMSKYADAAAEPAPAEGEQATNSYGVRLQGGGHSSFGAGVGVAFNIEGGTLSGFDLDEAGATALRFQLRSGIRGQGLELRVSISDVYSEPAGEQCVVRASEQSQCDPTWDGVSCDPQGCFDSAGTRLDVSDEWQTVTIPLSSLLRDNWGVYVDESVQPPPELESSSAYQLQLRVPQGLAQFDLWLDNIGFVVP